MRYVGFLIASLSAVVVTIASCGGGTGVGTTAGTGGTHPTSTTGTGTNAGGQQNTGGSTATGIDFDSGTGDSGSCSGATTCAAQGATCGPIGDGCGGILMCGDCTLPETCGGAGMASTCGKPPCTAKTCAGLGFDCGMNGDGCGGTLDCGTCTAPGDTCGGAGMTSVCGHTTVCTPKTCAMLGFNCGMNGDGCGGQVDCGATCPTGQTCGGGGMPSVCGAPPCTPKTCAMLGATCGMNSDGCGGLVDCGTCNLPQTCGGGGTANACGTPTATCTNLCLKQVTCANPAVTTTLTGTVYAPNGTDPLLGALVYVPNAPVMPFAPGVACESCGAAASGSPLVSAVSGVDGKFTLKNVPVGTNIPVVIQLGRWRRQITIASVPSCVTTAIPAAKTRLPKNKSEGDIPLMAFATGYIDALECVLRKVGIADSEFTVPYFMGGNGRIQIFTGNGGGGATINGDGSPTEDQLWSDPAVLAHYDMVLLPCQGGQYDQDPASQQNIINYTNAGGRLFTTHYSYVWLYNDAPFSGTAGWNPDQLNISADPQTGFIDTTFPKGLALSQWLINVGASSTLGQIQLATLREDIDNNSIVAPSQLWMTLHDPSAGHVPMHYTFNTPVGVPAAQQCGRVLYDDFHVEDANADPFFTPFPTECAGGAMTPQEKLLEFMIFDLGSCITPDIPTCTPKTCAQQGLMCGPAGDGCGNVIQCGPCPAGQTCGGGGMPSVCGSPSCTPKTCMQQSIMCGPAGDGCGNLIQCGNCPAGETCGGGGMPGVCGNQACTPKTCVQLGIQCGPAGNGCGGLLACGNCPAGQTCGGGGMSGVCGGGCTPKTCLQLGANCGPVGDGCGGVIQCGTCAAPQTCGGGGKASVCGGGGPG